MGKAVYTSKDFQSTLQLLSRCLGEGSFEIRHWARQCLYTIRACQPSDGELERSCLRAGLAAKQAEKMLDVASRPVREDGGGGGACFGALDGGDHFTISGSLLKQTTEAPLPPQTHTHTQPAVPAAGQEPHRLRDLLRDLGDGAWQTRCEKLARFRAALAEPWLAAHVREAGAFEKVLDALALRCQDQNQRAAALAMQALSDTVAAVSVDGSRPADALTPFAVSKMMTVLCVPLASATPTVAHEAGAVVEKLRSDVCPGVFGMAAAVALGGTTNPKVKSFFLQQMADCVCGAHAVNPTVTYSHVLPVCLRLLAEPRSDVRQANNALLLDIKGLLGSNAMQNHPSLPLSEATRLRDLLA